MTCGAHTQHLARMRYPEGFAAARTTRALLCVAVMSGPTGLALAQSSAPGADISTPAITVTVDRLQIERDQSAAPVRIVTREELEKLPVRDVQSALATLPNVFIQRTGSIFDEGSIQMYGISGQARAPTRNVIAIDGVPLNSGMFPETSLNMVPLNLVERIEVIQGPGSSAYGANAFTGVINIVTRKPTRTTANVTAQVGTEWSTSDTSVLLGTGVPGEGWITGSVQLRETLGHLQPGGREDFSDSRLKNAALVGEKRFGNAFVSGTFLQYDFDRHNPSFINRPFPSPTAGPTAVQEQGYRQHGNLGVRYLFSDAWEGELRVLRNTFSSVSAQTFRTDLPPTGPNAVPPANEDRYANGGLARLTWTTARNVLQVGYEYADARLVNNLATGATRPQYKGKSDGFYVQDRLLLLEDQLSLSAGYRYDKFDFYDEASNSYKAGFAYKPTGGRWLVRGNLGRGFSPPAFNQLFNVNQPFGNAALSAETLTLWELGGEIWPRDGIRLGASAFYGKHKDPIFPRQKDQCVNPVPGIPAGQNQFCNVFPPPEYIGYTLTADWNPAPGWHIGGSYTFTDPQTVTGTQGATTITNTYTFHSNRHQAKAVVTYAHERFTLGAEALYAEGRYWGDNFSNPVDAFTVVNLRGTYRIDAHWSLLATLFNVFDEDYATRADRAVQGGQEVFAGIPQPGRFAMLGVSYGF